MSLSFLLDTFADYAAADAIVFRDQPYSYAWLLDRVGHWRTQVADAELRPGTVALIEADFSPNSVALLLALIEAGAIVVPLSDSVAHKRDEFAGIAQGEISFRIDPQDRVEVTRHTRVAKHELYAELRGRAHPGLVLFSSGSTGQSKAAVHDLVPMLEKFKIRRHRLRAISFLLYDHIGGFNTMLYTLANGGCMVTVEERTPDAVLRAIDAHRVQLLPTSPTFLNLVLLSGALERHDLTSLETVTYGTEPMHESTLQRLRAACPEVKLLQTYGLSEVGILRSKSKSSDSLWVKIGGEGFETRVVDGILHIKAQSAMLGYLNAPAPFTADGWFNTGDSVLVDGEYLRILGRESELINVGGEKVYPAEVESVIQDLDGVADVAVSGAPHPITGQIVTARIQLARAEDPRDFKRRLKRHCRARMAAFKVPVKITLTADGQHGGRFKKLRRAQPEGADV